LLGALALRVGEHRFDGLAVGVQVGDEGEFHLIGAVRPSAGPPQAGRRSLGGQERSDVGAVIV
jgi:hypothetical protein